MSSDEDEPDGTCSVKTIPSRSEKVTALFMFLDLRRNRLNASGNRRPGGQPLVRIRRATAAQSTRPAVAKWPENMYRTTWLKDLSPAEKRELDPKDDIPIPEVRGNFSQH